MDELDSIVPPRWTITTKPRRSQEDPETRCQVYSTERQALQKRIFPTLLKMHRGGRSQIRPVGSIRRGLRRSHRGEVTGQEDHEDGLLLAHDATRRSKVCEEVWQLKEIWERLASSRWKDDDHFLTLAIRTMGNRHYRSPVTRKETDKIPARRNWLLHKMEEAEALATITETKVQYFIWKTLFTGSGFQKRSFQTTIFSSTVRHSGHFAWT